MTQNGEKPGRGEHEAFAGDGAAAEAPEVFTQPPQALGRSVMWGIVDAVLMLTVLGMLVTVSLQVVFRIAGNSLSWTEELTRFLFLWGIFLGMASGFRSAEHARITFVLRRLPPALRRLTVHLYVLLGVAFFAVVAYYGAMLSLGQYRSNETSPALGISLSLVTLAVSVSAGLALVAHIQSAYFDHATRESLEEAKETLE